MSIDKPACRVVRSAVKSLEWQDMATAPKDGSRVLAWRSSWEDRPTFVRWIMNSRTKTEFWNDAEEFDAYENEAEPPTHWLPMPKTPNVT